MKNIFTISILAFAIVFSITSCGNDIAPSSRSNHQKTNPVKKDNSALNNGIQSLNDTKAISVRAHLKSDAELSTENIEISVSNGIVTLTGTVSNSQLKQRAGELAKKGTGITSVINNLSIVNN